MDYKLDIKNLSKRFDKNTSYAIQNINLSIADNSIIAIIGESGSGKTTLSRLITGLETPNEGSIKLNNNLLSDQNTFVVPEKRNIGMVFQDYALFPHLTVEKNIAYGLKHKENKKQRVQEMLSLVGLEGFEKRYTHQLSGGQQQRVALARALAPSPQLLILDEPFSNLDVALKLQLRTEIFEVIKKTGVTAIFITHDIQDAMVIADEIVVLKDGNIEQKGTVKKLFTDPKNEYVASLFSDIISLSKDDLSLFNYPAKQNHKYAMRLHQFTVDKESNFKLSLNNIESSFWGTYYMNTGKLPNGKLFRFTSKEAIHETISVGFNEADLLKFEIA